jgi:hypothetical protein
MSCTNEHDPSQQNNGHNDNKHDVIETDSDTTGSWSDAFFDQHNILNTMQCLLLGTNQTIEDLSALCVAMNNNNVVLSFTHRGLMWLRCSSRIFCKKTKISSGL